MKEEVLKTIQQPQLENEAQFNIRRPETRRAATQTEDEGISTYTYNWTNNPDVETCTNDNEAERNDTEQNHDVSEEDQTYVKGLHQASNEEVIYRKKHTPTQEEKDIG